MQQDFVILKRARERETKRLLRVILSRVNYAKKAKGAINHFGSTQFKSDSHFDFPCSWIKNWSHCLTIYHAAEFSPYGMDDKTKTSSFHNHINCFSTTHPTPSVLLWYLPIYLIVFSSTSSFFMNYTSGNLLGNIICCCCLMLLMEKIWRWIQKMKYLDVVLIPTFLSCDEFCIGI